MHLQPYVLLVLLVVYKCCYMYCSACCLIACCYSMLLLFLVVVAIDGFAYHLSLSGACHAAAWACLMMWVVLFLSFASLGGLHFLQAWIWGSHLGNKRIQLCACFMFCLHVFHICIHKVKIDEKVEGCSFRGAQEVHPFACLYVCCSCCNLLVW